MKSKLIFCILGILATCSLYGASANDKETIISEELKPNRINAAGGFCYTAKLTMNRTGDKAGKSDCTLLEDDKPLSTPNADHKAIRESGKGCYSHWTADTLYFSTSDNSDPRTNGRKYTLISLKPKVDINLFVQDNKDFNSAVELFLQAKVSDNPLLDYHHSIRAFNQILSTSKDANIIARCHYFLAFNWFILKDYKRASYEALNFLKDARDVYPGNPAVSYANDIVAVIDDGSASLDDVLNSLVAKDMKTNALFGKSLKKYYEKANNNEQNKNNKEIIITISTLSIFSCFLCSAENLAEIKVDQALCQENMRKLIKGWRTYIEANNGDLPSLAIKVNNTGKSWIDNAYWPTIIGKYLPDEYLSKVKSDLECQSVRIPADSIVNCPGESKLAVDSYTVHYGMNYALLKKSGGVEKYSQIPAPDKIIVFTESNKAYSGPNWGWNYIQFRHSGGTNVAYADGHVDWISQDKLPKEINAGMWQP